MYLLDTNICIYALKDKYPALREKLLSVHPDEIAISSVSVFELEYGAAKSRWGDKTREVLRQFLSSYEILPFSAEDAEVCGQLRAALTAAGTPIGAYDVIIAAQGLARGIAVVTHNTREFERIPGLSLLDWAAG